MKKATKAFFSTPALSTMEHKPELRRYRSVSSAGFAETEEIRQEIMRMPFLAVPGMGRTLSMRMLSVRSFRHLGALEKKKSVEQKKAVGAPSSGDEQSDEEYMDMFAPELEANFTWDLILAVFVACLSAFQVGYNTGVINTPSTVIRASLLEPEYVSDLQWSIIVSIFCVGGLLGSYMGGSLADAYGRKRFMLANNVLFIAAGACFWLAHSVLLMAVGRLLLGMACGGVTVTIPLYLGEVSPAQLRGTLGTLYQFTMVVGILIANCLGKPLGGYDSWRILLAATVVPAILQLMFAPFLPESPRWLVSRGRKAEAEVVLSNLRGGNSAMDGDVVTWLIEAMEHSFADVDLGKGGTQKKTEGVCSGSLRKPLIIGLVLQFAQQLSGINAVFYYSTSFFERAHFRDPWLGSVLAAFVNVVATGVAVRLMDQAGRRMLLLVSSLGMFVSALLLTWALQLTSAHPTSVVLGYGSVISVLLFVTLFELGLGPIPWLITAEIFPSSAASTCMTITCSANWIFNFCVGLLFPTMQAQLETYVFLPFGVVCLLCFCFTLLYVPETRGKSLDQIQSDLRSHVFPGLSK